MKTKLTEDEYFEKAKYLWQNFVPESGQAETVQGELIRAIEKLRDEAQRNGNINWDIGHEILAKYIENILIQCKEFTDEQADQIKLDISRLLDYESPCTEDEIYDRLTNRIVDWYLKNEKPIANKHNPNLHR